MSERRHPVSAAELLRKEIPPATNWIEGGILPKGGLLLMGGLSKIGKSIIAMEYSRSLMGATPLFGKSSFAVGSPARVLYYEQEVGEFGVQKRLGNVFGDLMRHSPGLLEDRFFVLSKEPEIQLDTEDGIKYIEDDIDRICPNVIIFDPVDALHTGNDNDKQHVGNLIRVTELLREKFRALDLSVILIHHFKKPPDNEKFRENHDWLSPYNFTGSQRWFGAPDTLNTYHRLPGQRGGGHESWLLNTRFILRQDECPPDMRLTVNRDNDLRVRYDRIVGQLPTLKVEGKLGKMPEAEQEKLDLV